MPKASPIQNSFNAGELSPLLKGRIDLEKYRNGCEEMVNFLPQIAGPARKRPGTRFVREVKDSTQQVRLIPFEFSNEQAYVLEFGDGYIRFYADGGILLDVLGDPYEIASPYWAEDVSSIDFAQSADVVYLAHPEYPPHKLSRFGSTDWTIEPVEFVDPPFNDLNTDVMTLLASAATGNITITSSASFFIPEDVGGHIKFEAVLASKYDKWEPSKTITSGDLRQYEGNLYRATSGGSTGSRPPIHTEGSESDGTVTWAFVNNGYGYAEITGYTSATVVSATVIKELPALALSATTKWATGAWSDAYGYPRAVIFYEDRLWFAGSYNRPQTLWASTTGDYENHQYGTNDDDALNYTINTQDMNAIQWLSAGKVLGIGTLNGEFTLSATNISDPVTPTNVKILPQTTYGSAEGVRPQRVGGAILFLQRAGRKIREYVYNFETDSYVAPNLNVLADHIVQQGVSQISYQQEPYQIVWAARNDGVLAGMTYERSEDVVGWHRHTLGGSVESVVTIPHWDGDQDVLWMVVRRTINGQQKRYIEYMEKYFDDEYSFFVDSGLTYDGAPTSTLTGLDHLEGEEVAVLIDGAVHPNVTVTGGAISLQTPGSVINVGLPFIGRVKTMPLEAGAAEGVAQGKQMRINNMVIRLFESGPGLWYGPNDANMNEYHQRRTVDLMDRPVPLLTGDTGLLAWPSGYETGPQLVIEHRLPLPCTLVALMPQVHTYDR